MQWLVKRYDCNRRVICDMDLFPFFEEFLFKLKKQNKTQEEFSKEIQRELKYHFWSRSQYELILEIRNESRIVLLPLFSNDAEAVAIDVTDDPSFDWKGFAEKHTANKRDKTYAKIDIWDQIEYRYDEFVAYCWEGIQAMKRRTKRNKY